MEVKSMHKECISDNSAENYLKRFNEILDHMIQGMKEAELSNNISHNFIVQMIPHHQAAIEMSENILKYTNNQQLKSIANRIISEQTKSIENMQAIKSQCEKHTNLCPMLKSYQCKTNRILKTMFSEMSSAYSDDNINCNFLREMIPHHMGAVKMSNNALKYNLCPGLKPILESIIISQENGINQMRKFLCILNCKS